MTTFRLVGLSNTISGANPPPPTSLNTFETTRRDGVADDDELLIIMLSSLNVPSRPLLLSTTIEYSMLNSLEYRRSNATRVSESVSLLAVSVGTVR